MAGYSRKAGPVLAVLLLVAVAGYQVVMIFRSAAEAADHSAHEALASEILEKLAAVPPGQPYPASLSELQLTYPDGGDTLLLSRFSYHSTGTSCTVETTVPLTGERFVRKFPEDARPERIGRPWAMVVRELVWFRFGAEVVGARFGVAADAKGVVVLSD